jgi:preprotein translocase subunit SecF
MKFPGGEAIKLFYQKKYKLLMIIPAVLLVLALIQIGVQTATTGSFIHKDISLKGGTTLTVFSDKEVTTNQIVAAFSNKYPGEEFSARSLEEEGSRIGFIVDTSIEGEESNKLINTVEGLTGPLTEEQYSIDVVGSALGSSFFKQTMIAVAAAFALMAIVVFIYFKVPIPCLAVILCAFSDIIVTMAIINVLGVKVSTAGIASFLMLIGYSVDTDILLSTHMLMRRDISVINRVFRAIYTGIMTTGTTLFAVTIGLIFSKSDVISEIMLIVFIGLIVDIIFTWIANAGILRLYLERKHGQED